MSKDNAHLRDILDSARLIQSYLKGMSFGDFESDTVRQDAVMRRFEIIGEATKRLSVEVLSSGRAVRVGALPTR